jgi:hypothetical protein
MIVGVSRRTDVSAFQADWFLSCLRLGQVQVANPFRPTIQRQVSLRPEAVDAFVFWTRNPLPLIPHLDKIAAVCPRFYFLVTVTGYPPFLEPNCPDLGAVERFLRLLHERIGRRRIIWRYDPIIISAQLSREFHEANFARLADLISPFAFRVVMSFWDCYRKLVQRFVRRQFSPLLPAQERQAYLELLSAVTRLAESAGLEVRSCAEKADLELIGVRPGKCVDNDLLQELFGLHLPYRKDPGQRQLCRCQASVDIGAYGTCRGGCLYCYAC